MAVALGDAIYKKGNDSDNESDIWDDTALIEAYDNAVSSMQKQLSGHGIERQQNSGKGCKEKGKSNHNRKRKKKAKNKKDNKAEQTSSVQWKVGLHCRAVYTEDGEIYQAVIKSLDLANNTAVVRFLGYGNEEEQDLDDLLPSEVMSRQQRGMSQTSEAYSESDAGTETPPTWSQSHQRRKGSTASSRGRGVRGPSPVHGPFGPLMHGPPGPPSPMTGWGAPSFPPPPLSLTQPWPGPPSFNPLNSLAGGTPPLIPGMSSIPPPLVVDTEDLQEDKEALHSMLISWYMSGYNTGYYQGLRDGKHKKKTAQSGAAGEHKEQNNSTRKS